MNEILINGIYDLRTLISLQADGIKNYSFDFNPKSQSFIQEYIFVELLKNISSKDFIHLKMKNNDDYFITKLLDDINNSGLSKDQFCFIFDEVTTSISQFKYPFMTYYRLNNLKIFSTMSNLKGLIFNFKELERMYLENSLNHFYNNLFLTFNNFLDLNICLDLDWNDSLISSLNDLFEFNFFIYSINNHVEVCYRNVNLLMLKSELNFKRKEIIF